MKWNRVFRRPSCVKMQDTLTHAAEVLLPVMSLVTHRQDWPPVAQWLPDLLLPMSKPEGRVTSFQSGHLTAFGPMSSFRPCRRLFCQSFTWTLHSPPPRPVSLHRTNTEAAPRAGQTPRSREKRHTRQVASPPRPHPAVLLRAPRLTRDIGENCEASIESSPEVQKGQRYG